MTMYPIVPHSEPTPPFVWWDDAFTDAELGFLQQKAIAASNRGEVGGARGAEVNESIRRSNIDWVERSSETDWLFSRLANAVSVLNSQFYQYDLTGFGEAIQLTNYDQSEHGMYGWHQDFGGGGVSRKLSLVLQLSDPASYEGGNLEMFGANGPEPIQKKRGLITIFPSYTWHQVTPVTRGSRQSLVAWISGPRFK